MIQTCVGLAEIFIIVMVIKSKYTVEGPLGITLLLMLSYGLGHLTLLGVKR